MHRPSRCAVGLLALLIVAQSASALTVASWHTRELGPAFGREDYQTLAYELGPPSAADTGADYPGFGRDLHYFVVVGPPHWPDGTVVHNTGDRAYDQSGWEAWGGTCYVGMDSALVAGGFPMPVCVGSDGNLWGFWGANGQFQITVNDPQLMVRPAVASRGDWSFDTFYAHSGTLELWHTGWSPAGGWIDEPVVVNGTPIYASPWLGGVDAAWAGFGATALWTNKIVVTYVGLDGRPNVLTGAFASSGHAASNNINWTSNVVVSSKYPQRFPSIAFVGSAAGTTPIVFYDEGPDVCFQQQLVPVDVWTWSWGWFPLPTVTTHLNWSAPTAIPHSGSYCGDVAARAAPNGSLGSKINLWQPHNFQLWGLTR